MGARWPCFICGEETHDMEYAESDGFRRGSSPWTCARHVAQLIQTWRRFFPGTGLSYTAEEGIQIAWDAMKTIEEHFERDVATRVYRYAVSDKEARLGRYETLEEVIN